MLDQSDQLMPSDSDMENAEPPEDKETNYQMQFTNYVKSLSDVGTLQ